VNTVNKLRLQVAFGSDDGESVTVEFEEAGGDAASAKMMMDLLASSASDEVKQQLRAMQKQQRESEQ
jgi:hypothetical protein